MKFLGADLVDYAAVLKKSGFTEQEYTGEKWELRKRLRVDGAWYMVTISDNGGNEIPEVSYSFRKESD